MENLNAVAVIIGVVSGISLLGAPQVTPFVKFIIAVVLGLLFGVVGLFGLNVETGLIAALTSAGLYKVATKVGGN